MTSNEEPELGSRKRKRKEGKHDAGDRTARKKSRKRKESSGVSQELDFEANATRQGAENPQSDPALLGSAVQSDQTATMSLLSAIVAAATGQPPPSFLSNQIDMPSDHSNDPVLQVLQDIDITRITSVLKTLGDAAAAADMPFAVMQARPAQIPQPLGQVPASSEIILSMADNPPPLDAPIPPMPTQPQHFTRSDHAELLATKWLSPNKLAQLVVKEGLVYKKGKFSSIEEHQIKAAIENYRITRGLTLEQLDGVIFPKNGQDRDNAFWTEITYAVPQRPIVAVYHYVRRAYHPVKPQGSWLPSEDDRLREAVANLGQQWEKVSEMVGRRAVDCRDRYRNHLVNKDIRVTGAWSPEEEEELTKIVTEMTVQQGKDMDNDIFWGLVSARMGGKRGRQQCRIKWTDCLSKVTKSEGKKPRWGARDAFILVQKVDSLSINDDTEIDWKTLPDANWNLWSAHVLQRRWLTMKRSIKGYEELSHQELIEILKAKKGLVVPPPPLPLPEASSSKAGKKKKEKGKGKGAEPDSESSESDQEASSSQENWAT